MANEKEYQHYVPQMYLRNFSANGKSIGGFLLAERKYVSDMAVDRICGRKYLYGEDLLIEKWFSELEGNWATLLKKIISQESLDLSESEWAYLYMFAFLSDARTGYLADSTTDMMTKTVQSYALLSREHGQIDFTDEEISNLRVSIDKPNLAHLQIMPSGIEVMADLTPVLIINSTRKGFITSDCPLVRYNPLFVKRQYNRSSGLGHVGAQIFIPLSPRLCFMLYDEAVYEMCSTNRTIRLNSPDQIIRLNTLFAHNAKSVVLFNNHEQEWLIKKYTGKVKDTSNSFTNVLMKGESGGYLVMASTPSITYDANLSFFLLNEPFLKIPFPNNAAGPLRPNVQRITDRMSKEQPSPKLKNDVFWPIDV